MHVQMPHSAAIPEGSFLVTDGCLGVPGPAVKQVMLVVPQLIQELHCNSLKGFEAGEVLQQQLGCGYCVCHLGFQLPCPHNVAYHLRNILPLGYFLLGIGLLHKVLSH